MTNFKKSALAAALVAGFGWAGASSAATLPDISFDPTLNGGAGAFTSGIQCGVTGSESRWSCIAGEGAAPNTNPAISAPATIQYIDWMVAYDSQEADKSQAFYYFYSIENSGAGVLNSATVGGQVQEFALSTVGWKANAGMFSLGGSDFDDEGWVSAGTDNFQDSQGVGEFAYPTTLREIGHNAINFANLAGETNDDPAVAPDPLIEDDWNEPNDVQFGSLIGIWNAGIGQNVENRCEANEECGVFGGRGSAPAITNFNADGQAGANPTQWASNQNGGLNIVAPGVPEPATTALLGLSLLGLGVFSRRKRA